MRTESCLFIALILLDVNTISKRMLRKKNLRTTPFSARRAADPRLLKFLQDRNKPSGKMGNDGPARGPGYDPNYGYEPYWKDGHWVFPTTLKTDNPCVNTVKCYKMYSDYGSVCARNLGGDFKTYGNYCDLLLDDCKNPRDEWMIVRRGTCWVPVLKVFEERSRFFKQNAMDVLEEYEKKEYTTVTGYMRTRPYGFRG